jgi:hypothetical protein
MAAQDFWLFPSPAVDAYFERRQRSGADPYPQPQTEREDVLHRLWLTGVIVAGAELEETEYLRDLLQKYEVTQRQEAERMAEERAERVRKSLYLPRPEQISERLRDVMDFNKAKRDGRRRLYAGSGTTSL